jgi:sugar transferase (PEP-CTERM/EpsH1 system associated)
MRILVLTPRFPYPPNRGDAVRAWKEVQFLARNHDVWLACLDTGHPNINSLEHVRSCCRDVAVVVRPGWHAWLRGAWNLAGGRSLCAGFYDDGRLRRLIADWHAAINFDATLAFGSVMGALANTISPATRVLDMNDVESEKYRAYARRRRGPMSALYRLEAERFAKLENEVAHASTLSLLVNERERQKLARRSDAPPTAVLATCVDTAGLSSAPPNEPSFIPKRPIIGMLGSMNYPPNVQGAQWFGQHVWPMIRKAHPNAEWWIVGRDPTAAVQQWQRSPGVTVTGWVADILPYLRQMRVVVNPIRGDLGVQTKTIMALGAGKPAVVTPDVAGGIDYPGEAPFLVASIPDRFASAVGKLLTDDRLARRLSTRSQQVARSQYDPEQQLPQLEAWLAAAPSPQSGVFVADSHGRSTVAPPAQPILV